MKSVPNSSTIRLADEYRDSIIILTGDMCSYIEALEEIRRNVDDLKDEEKIRITLCNLENMDDIVNGDLRDILTELQTVDPESHDSELRSRIRKKYGEETDYTVAVIREAQSTVHWLHGLLGGVKRAFL